MRPFIHSRPYFIYACKKYARVEIHSYLTFSAKLIKFSKNQDVAVNCSDKDDSDCVGMHIGVAISLIPVSFLFEISIVKSETLVR